MAKLCAGILDDPRCKWKSDELDHAVLLVGYGTCPKTGKDYWLIRNSWSTYWGDKVIFVFFVVACSLPSS